MSILKKPGPYLALGFVIVSIFMCWGYIKESVLNVYHLTVLPTSKVSGHIESKEMIDDLSGGRSFEYSIAYKVDGRVYRLIESFSPDSLVYAADSSVWVRYSNSNPAKATTKENSSHFLEIGFVIVIISFFGLIAKQAFLKIRLGEDFSD